MSIDPYRTLPPRVAPLSRPRAHAAWHLAVVLGLVWLLAALRVVAALTRAEAASFEVNLAWLTVIVAPLAIGSEIAAARRDRS